MSDYLANLFARSFDRTGDIPVVSARVPALFEPSQELWRAGIEAPSTSTVIDPSGDKQPPPSLAGIGVEPERLGQDPNRHCRESTEPGKDSRTLSHLDQSPGERYAGVAEKSAGPRQPDDMNMSRLDPHILNVPRTSAKPCDDRANSTPGREDMHRESATRETAAAEKQAVPMQGEKRGSFSVSERRRKPSTPPAGQSRKEPLMIADVVVDKRAERILDGKIADTESGAPHEVQRPQAGQQRPPLLVEPILDPWRNSGQSKTGGKTEPTIQVTIGRIEVRAVTAPVQARPKPETAGSLSLEEYLKRRSGGRR